MPRKPEVYLALNYGEWLMVRDLMEQEADDIEDDHSLMSRKWGRERAAVLRKIQFKITRKLDAELNDA